MHRVLPPHEDGSPHLLPDTLLRDPTGGAKWWSSDAEMLLRAMVSSTLKSQLRHDKSLGTPVLNQTDTSLESLRSATPSREGTGEGRWGAAARTNQQQGTGRVFQASCWSCCCSGNSAGGKSEGAAYVWQVQGPCIDDRAECNNNTFNSEAVPPISYSNYTSRLRDVGTLQLLSDQHKTEENKQNFLSIEVMTIYNFECECWYRILPFVTSTWR